jgi:hypothetical protein
MSSTEVARQLLIIGQDYSLYCTGIIFIAGFFGNIINILVFSTLKLFRSNQCTFYLTIESIANIGLLLTLFLIRYLFLINGTDPGKTSLFWCKLRIPLGQIFRLISTSMICFAAFDQFLSTNPRPYLRQLSTLSLARRLTVISTCISLLHTIPFAIYYNIDASQTCGISNIDLIHYYSYFYYPILHGFLPIVMSSLFSLLAYRNVRHLVRREVSVIRRRLDRQLTAMIFVRVIFFIILLLPYSIHRIYLVNVSIDQSQDLFKYAINQLIELIVISLMNLNYAVR